MDYSTVKRVLIFPCGAENALELHDSLSQCVNIEVWGASSRSDHGRHVFRNYIADIPFIQDSEFLEAFGAVLRGCRIDAVFPTHDAVAEFFANHRSKIPSRVIMAEDETARICREKRRTYELFADCSFTPRVHHRLADVHTYPVVLKPNAGEGGKNIHVAANREEAEHALALHRDLLIVEHLPGRELTVDCFTDRHRHLRFVGPRSRSRVSYGISVNSEIVPVTPEIRDIAAEINRRLRMRGLWFFQLKQSVNGDFKLLEICTRTAGTMCVHRQRGVNLPLLSVYDAMDMEVEILANDFHVEVDRALFNRFRVGIEYDTIYLDFDDTLVFRGEVNRFVLLLLHQAAHEGKAVHLLTRHDGDIRQALNQANVHPGLFRTIQQLAWNEKKHNRIKAGEKAIFIDNSYAERRVVLSKTGIPVFDADAVPALLDWRR